MTVFNTFFNILLSFLKNPLLSDHLNKMEFTVQNNSLLYSFSFNEETARISIRDLSNGLYESVITLTITVWHIFENRRQQFDTYHQVHFPITENQLGSQAMGHEVSVISGHHYPHKISLKLRRWQHSIYFPLGRSLISQLLVL